MYDVQVQSCVMVGKKKENVLSVWSVSKRGPIRTRLACGVKRGNQKKSDVTKTHTSHLSHVLHGCFDVISLRHCVDHVFIDIHVRHNLPWRCISIISAWIYLYQTTFYLFIVLSPCE